MGHRIARRRDRVVARAAGDVFKIDDAIDLVRLEIDGQGRFNAGREGDIDAHAPARVIREIRAAFTTVHRIVAGSAIQRVITTQAPKSVVAGTAKKRIVAVIADQAIVAERAAVEGEAIVRDTNHCVAVNRAHLIGLVAVVGFAETVRQVVVQDLVARVVARLWSVSARAATQRVGAQSAIQCVVAREARQGIVAAAAVEHIPEFVAAERVITQAAGDVFEIDQRDGAAVGNDRGRHAAGTQNHGHAGGELREIDRVEAITAIEYVIARAGVHEHQVIAGAARHQIRSASRHQRVVAGAAEERFIGGRTDHGIRESRADDHFEIGDNVALGAHWHGRGDGRPGQGERDACLRVVIKQRVFASATIETVIAEAAPDRVGACIADNQVIARAAEEAFEFPGNAAGSASHSDSRRRSAVKRDGDVTGCAGIIQNVGARATLETVARLAAGGRIIAGTEIDSVGERIGHDSVVAARADHVLETADKIDIAKTDGDQHARGGTRHVIGQAGDRRRHIIRIGIVEHVASIRNGSAGIAKHAVVTKPARDRVAALATDKRISPAAADQHIPERVTKQRRIARTSNANALDIAEAIDLQDSAACTIEHGRRGRPEQIDGDRRDT